SARDVIACLERHRFAGRVSIVSRRGLLPRPHAPVGAVTPLAPQHHAAPHDLLGLLRWGRTVVRETVTRGEPWQHAIDAMRPHVVRLWRGLPPADRARFARIVRPYWDVLRHRAPPETIDLVDSWRHAGRLE